MLLTVATSIHIPASLHERIKAAAAGLLNLYSTTQCSGVDTGAVSRPPRPVPSTVDRRMVKAGTVGAVPAIFTVVICAARRFGS